jgi:hypothetical protein
MKKHKQTILTFLKIFLLLPFSFLVIEFIIICAITFITLDMSTFYSGIELINPFNSSLFRLFIVIWIPVSIVLTKEELN